MIAPQLLITKCEGPSPETQGSDKRPQTQIQREKLVPSMKVNHLATFPDSGNSRGQFEKMA